MYGHTDTDTVGNFHVRIQLYGVSKYAVFSYVWFWATLVICYTHSFTHLCRHLRTSSDSEVLLNVLADEVHRAHQRCLQTTGCNPNEMKTEFMFEAGQTAMKLLKVGGAHRGVASSKGNMGRMLHSGWRCWCMSAALCLCNILCSRVPSLTFGPVVPALCLLLVCPRAGLPLLCPFFHLFTRTCLPPLCPLLAATLLVHSCANCSIGTF
jgi:hypothetical protein